MKPNLLICLLLITNFCFGQTNEFAPIGAKWWYTFSQFSADGFVLIESKSDTIIEGKNCRLLEKTLYVKDLAVPTPVIDTFMQDNLYVYSDSGVVYNYVMGTFYKLYDFNAEVDDVWEVAGVLSSGICDSTGQVKVDATNYITIAGAELRQIFTSSYGDGYWNFGSKSIIERIGSLNYLFAEPSNCLFDFYQGGPLRCYYDNTIGYYQIDSTMSCDFIVNINQEISEAAYHIWPNPVSDNLNISSPNDHHNIFLSIHNASGQIVFHKPLEGTLSQIDMSTLPKGIYLVKIASNTINSSYKILKL